IIKFYLASRNEVFRKTKRISELAEGEIPAESIVEIEGKIERAGPLEMGKIIKHLKANNLGALRQMLSRRGREIVSRKRAMGVTENEIRELEELVKKGMLEDKIGVKLSAPFVPAVLIAFIASGFLGDIIWRILL
ncbi:MAG: A24 family peptidase C-terminal domain-containing protein, partial [archaeon]